MDNTVRIRIFRLYVFGIINIVVFRTSAYHSYVWEILIILGSTGHEEQICFVVNNIIIAYALFHNTVGIFKSIRIIYRKRIKPVMQQLWFFFIIKFIRNHINVCTCCISYPSWKLLDIIFFIDIDWSDGNVCQVYRLPVGAAGLALELQLVIITAFRSIILIIPDLYDLMCSLLQLVFKPLSKVCVGMCSSIQNKMLVGIIGMFTAVLVIVALFISRLCFSAAVIFTVIFGKIIRIRSPYIAYAVYMDDLAGIER